MRYRITSAVCGLSLSVLILTTGCGGRPANPVLVQQYGDSQKSCAALESEIRFTESEIQRLVPETHKTGKNVALGVTGAFFIVPLFFMDLSKAEQIEVNALRQRYNHLAIVAEDKNCELDVQPVPVIEEPKEEESRGVGTP